MHPYYEIVVPELKRRGIVPVVDSQWYIHSISVMEVSLNVHGRGDGERERLRER